MLLVNFNYNFKCDWHIELSDNKLSDNKVSDNNLTGELVGNRSSSKPITNEEIVIFMINRKKISRNKYPENRDFINDDNVELVSSLQR